MGRELTVAELWRFLSKSVGPSNEASLTLSDEGVFLAAFDGATPSFHSFEAIEDLLRREE